MAIACGVSLFLQPSEYEVMAAFCAEDDRLRHKTHKTNCTTFDAAADGFLRAEGCEVLVIKRVSEAVKDRFARSSEDTEKHWKGCGRLRWRWRNGRCR